MIFQDYDIIVVGAGHAGCEAAAAAAKLGSRVLLVTMNLTTIAQMSCNPSIGGVAKGQLVREIDALGGMTARIADASMLQFRMLNRSKGPAMWSPRTQNDRYLFHVEWRKALESINNLHFLQDSVKSLIFSGNALNGVQTGMGYQIKSKAVVLTAGTFLNGRIHIGEKSFSGGRIGETSENELTQNFTKNHIKSGRLKTGTPVRIDGRSVDFSKLDTQNGDENPGFMSFASRKAHFSGKQLPCYIAFTNQKVHEILSEGFDRSPLFMGRIGGIGPRYCPSIEDKIVRFASKDSHQLFLEPEGWNTHEYYLGGFSSSLPDEIQVKALREIPGFEKARIFRPGYAIEYDFFHPDQLQANLESKIVDNLFFAGQVNGTTGYEEAAAQGLYAGINAHNRIHGLKPFFLARSDAYIGVLIDDLITKELDEPYRLFTSRAEFRTLLRQDNADFRLTPIGYSVGLATREQFEDVKIKYSRISRLLHFIGFDSAGSADKPGSRTSQMFNSKQYLQLLMSPGNSIAGLAKEFPEFLTFANSIGAVQSELEQVEILIKYSDYIQKEGEQAGRLEKYEGLFLSPNLDYNSFKSLSTEARQKLQRIKPSTLGQAARISGISPSDLSFLLIYLNKKV